MNIEITATIPDLWGDKLFSKTEWGGVNYLVGPNGSGKTRFAEHLKNGLSQAGLKPRYLSAERLAGLEKDAVMGHGGPLHQGFNVGSYAQYRSYGEQTGLAADAFVILKEKINVRIKIEAFLSSLFGRRIRFAEEGGFLKPKMQRILGGTEYVMKESECHGLKELITLLAFIYDDQFNAMIIDEPELHLHPQFQTFLLSEIRKSAGDPRTKPGSKVFFLITHSPYLLDFRVLDDLRQCIIFHVDALPTAIGPLSAQDEFSLKRLLPRLNTHHKQFFFAQRPIFVEGYTDQQLFTLLQDSMGKLLGATGACFIDVNGKDEQDFFFRLCKHLQIDAQFIADLDVITRGSFRNSISDDGRSRQFVSEHGIGADLMDAIRELNIRLDLLARAVGTSSEHALSEIQETLRQAPDTEEKRYRVLMATIHMRQLLVTHLPTHQGEIDYIVAKMNRIREGAQAAGVFLLPKGALENHLPYYAGSPFQIPENAKSRTFEAERDFILANIGSDTIASRYSDIIPLLDLASGVCEVDLRRHLGYAISVFIGNVQMAFERGELKSKESLEQHASVEWSTFTRILDVIAFNAEETHFSCRIKLRALVDADETEVTFTDTTVHSKFALTQ